MSSVNKDKIGHYIERLEHYFITNCVTDEQRKKSLMLTAIGASAYKLLRSLTAPERPNDKSFGELVELMKKHYDPAPAESVHRFRFHTRTRHTEESISSYISEIRTLADKCSLVKVWTRC